MKIIAGIITFLLITFLVEPALVSWFVNLFTSSMNDWKPILKVIIWCFVFCGGFGLSIIISLFVGVIVSAFGK